MGLTLKEVYELRKGLISFTNQLFNTKSKFKFQVIPDAWKDFEKSFSFYFKPNVEQDKRKKIKDVFFKNANNCLTKSQKDLGQRIVALDVYAYLVEKYEELKNDNKGQEHNIVIEEFRKNIDIFKSQLLKNNMFEFELIDKLEDKNRNRKEIHTIQKEVKAVESCFKAEIERLIFELVNAKTELEVIDYNLNGIDARNDGLLKSDNFVLFTPEEINQKDKKFFEFIKNSGFTHSQFSKIGFYELPKSIDESPYTGYKYNQEGKLVEKESKNFLEAIVYFFARLFNSSDVTAYNNALIQAKDAAYSENVEKDLNKMYVEEAKKDALDIEKAFDELNKNADNPPIQNELPEYIKSNKLNNEHIKQELIEIEENRERMINEPDNGLSLD